MQCSPPEAKATVGRLYNYLIMNGVNLVKADVLHHVGYRITFSRCLEESLDLTCSSIACALLAARIGCGIYAAQRIISGKLVEIDQFSIQRHSLESSFGRAQMTGNVHSIFLKHNTKGD
jgi:hypothetical protein